MKKWGERSEAPLVSVITTVYNTEQYVGRCFDSVMEQTYAHIEFIIVDNASGGSIAEIAEQYIRAYPERRIKLVRLEENRGIYHGRLAGAEAASGDFLAFIDSDDRVSVDYYRALVAAAVEAGADMAASNVVYEEPDGGMFCQNHNPWFNDQWTLSGGEILDFFMGQEGSLFSANFIWNKIYARTLWDRAYPEMRKNTTRIVMYDDLALSLPLHYYANKFLKLPVVQYYYYQRDSANSRCGNSAEKFSGILQDIDSVFRHMERFLGERCPGRYERELRRWKERYFRVWSGEIAASKLTPVSKRLLASRLTAILGGSSPPDPADADNFFYDIRTPFYDGLEHQIRRMLDPAVKYVSFDVFDTLLERPLFQPEDLFDLLAWRADRSGAGSYYRDLKPLRIEAERQARLLASAQIPPEEDVSIDRIYAQLGEMLSLPEDETGRLKAEEIRLEKELCRARKIGKYLYDIAAASGKRIICISDMYLHEADIREMLVCCGCRQIEKVYVSSEVLLAKHTGSLYRRVLSELSVKPSELIHIGDNYVSDVCMAQKFGIPVIHLISGRDNFSGNNKLHYHGSFAQSAYFSSPAGQFAAMFPGIRCQLGLMASRSFDNPFTDYNPASDFNGSPYDLGYCVLGSCLMAACTWLIRQLRGKGCQKIHFIARDGLLFRTAYDMLSAGIPDLPASNYLRVSRRALFPLAVASREDLYTIHAFYHIQSFTPEKLLQYLAPIVPEDRLAGALARMEQSGVVPGRPFSSLSHWLAFMRAFERHCYDQEAVDAYREKMRQYFQSILPPNSCTFDAGYSGRTESILSRLLGYPIDACYLHANEPRCFTNAEKLGFSVRALCTSSAPVPRMVLLETLISETGGTCAGYEEDAEGNIVPRLEESSLNFQGKFTLSALHRGALDFIGDWVSVFGPGGGPLPARPQDMLLPMEYFMGHAKICEKHLFSAIHFEDPMFFDAPMPVSSMLEELREDGPAGSFRPDLTAGLPLWKQAAILLLTDRKTLKHKVKRRLSGHPVLLRLAKTGYGIPRSIYHLFKR